MNATNDDIRRLLRSFGMQADEAMQAAATNARGAQVLRFRLVVEDVTDYGGTNPRGRRASSSSRGRWPSSD